MQHISTYARACVLAAALVSMQVVAFAESDGSFSGTVIDPSGSSVSGATIVARNERTGEERVVVANADGRYVLTGLRPSIYTIKVTFQGFAPVEYTGVQLAAAQEFPLDLTLQAAGVTEAVTVKGNATAMDLSSARIGVNVSEREVQNLPVNGRQMSQLMLQAPGSQNAGTGTWQDIRFSGRADEQNVIKFDGVEGSAIIDAAPGNIERPDCLAVQAAGQPRERAGVPRRVEQLSGRVRHRHRRPGQRHHQVGREPGVTARCSSTSATTSSTRPTTSTRPATPTAASFRNCPSRRCDSTSSAARSAARFAKDRAFFFGSYEGYRLDAGVNFVEAAPSAAAWARAVPAIAALRPGFTAPGAVMLPGASANPDFDIYQLQSVADGRGELASASGSTSRFNDQWSSYVRVFHDQRHAAAPGRRQRPRRHGDEQPDQRDLQPAGHAERRSC